MQKILIYSAKITERISYIFDFILNEFSGIEAEFTTDKSLIKNTEWPIINYSDEKIGNEIFLKSDDFMFEIGISDKINFDELNNIGKCFYALSRYEEYLPNEKDMHGRLSGKNRVYKIPFIDSWVMDFQRELKTVYPKLEFKKRNFEIILTSDVDQAWKYKNKGFFRTFGGLFTDLLKGNFNEISKKQKVILGKQRDPFDTYIYFKKLSQKYNLQLIFFWLMADYSKFDKNIPVKNHNFQKLIQRVSEWSEVGIHPSYKSFDQPEKVKTEIRRLEMILDNPVTKSRQHYLRLSFPETYQNLIANGIADDYTMAYADETGFRAGTTTPFFWYDLEKEEKTGLKIHPLCAMEVAMRNYMKLNPKQAKKELSRLKTEIKKVNGQMMLLFHNSNLNDDWEGWNEVLESTLE